MYPYQRAQSALADLKGAIYETLSLSQLEGMTNAQIGRSLGIYTGHVGHEGHIPRTLLAIMEQEGVVEQDEKSKRWTIRKHSAELSWFNVKWNFRFGAVSELKGAWLFSSC
jgi:hypothetical protein